MYTPSRVLFLTYNFPPKLGGMEQVIWKVWKRLEERSDAIALAQFLEEGTDDSPNVHRAPGPGLPRFFRFLYSKGRGLIRERNFDIVVASNAMVSPLALRLAKSSRARSVAMTYGLDVIHDRFIYQRAIRYALPKMDLVLTISSATSEQLLIRGVAAERMRIIPPGCDPAPFINEQDTEGLRKRWGLEGRQVILSAGRLVRRKGIDWFVRECLPRVLGLAPDAALLLAGGNPEQAILHDEDMVHAVEQAAEDASVRERVVITGRLSQEELAGAFQLADAFILPAVPVQGDIEGFGIVLLEAGAAGLPVVASNLGGIPDAVVDGQTGRLVPPLNPSAFSAAVVEMLRDRELADLIGRTAKQRVVDSFSWDTIADRYVDAILGIGIED